MNRLLIAVIALGIVCGASSCNLWRRVTGRQKAAPVTDSAGTVLRLDSILIAPDTSLVRKDTMVVPVPIVDSQKQALIQTLMPLWNAQTPYTTFSGKAKVNYEGKGESHDFVAAIRMEKDKRIWIAITGSMLGLTMEAARILITPDSMIAIDRIHKEVRILPFAEADKLLPVHTDFATLQALIIGDVLHTSHSLTDASDTGAVFLLNAAAQDYLQQVSFNKADTTISAQTLATGNALLQALYYNYNLTGNRRFANNRELNMQDKGEPYHMTLDFTKATFDEPVDMSFSIPSKYERK